MKKATLRLSAVIALVVVCGSQLLAQPRVVSKFGAARVEGRDVVVEVWVVVPPGLEANQAALAALREQGARPFQGDEFSTTGLVWDEFSDGIPGNDFVVQNYNPANDPTGAGDAALDNTHSTWTDVASSGFVFADGGETGRCPSLVRECPGRQRFDGNNDVAWLALGGCCTLAVTWFGTSIDEADMALNTNFPWATNGNDFDVETVMLHENGHVAGLGHSDEEGAVMEPYYEGKRRTLHSDDIDGITYLYPGGGCMQEVCDGLDNDCDGTVDNGFDSDNDGYTTCGNDCDDADPTINPGASEVCGDGIDQDCDGSDLACPGGGGCDLGQVGDSCTVDADCCSNKCKGGKKGKTCKAA